MKWLLYLAIFITGTAVAQKKDSTRIGNVNGIVRDSAHDYELPSATVAVYNATDSSLVSFQLSDNFGQFRFKQLPTGRALRVHITYVGYRTFQRTFTISFKHPDIDLGVLNLDMKGKDLEEVIISVPPVQLNGDTLEFNAQAFKLDPNAQTEDLLKMLPGVTVWSDGSITVNGKQVSMVLVEGKPFFGGNAKIATQNIPKNAVDKIQVYQVSPNVNNPMDSVTAINIKLMKNKKAGYFGRVSAGAGTNERYESDLSLNAFTPRTQLSLAGAANNTNKIANDVKTILASSTFKGVGASIAYQPELDMQGYNYARNGGLTLLHDFIPDPGYYKNNRLTAGYFMKDHTNTLYQQSSATTTLPGTGQLVQQSDGTSRGQRSGQDLTAGYNKKNKVWEYSFNATFNNTHNNTTSDNLSTAVIDDQAPASSNKSLNTNNNTENRLSLETGFKRIKPFSSFNKRPGDYEVMYTLNVYDRHELQQKESQFVSYSNSLENRDFNRLYNKRYNSVEQRLFAKGGNIIPWVFGIHSNIARLRLHLQNTLEINTDQTKDLVKDKEQGKDSYAVNPNLTNNAKHVTVDEMPALVFSRAFNRLFDNRYQQTLSFEVNLQGQFWYQKNEASQAFQNLRNSYKKFVPDATISYLNDQFGAFRDLYRLAFNMRADYPSVYQLAPLTDSADMYYIQTGNPLLKPADKRELTFTMSHSKTKANHPFNYTISLFAGIVNNYLTTASDIDELGRSVFYYVNADREKHAGGTLAINKAFRFGRNQLEGKLTTSMRVAETPNLVNQTWNRSDVFSDHQDLTLAYTYGDILATSLSYSFNYYRSKQDAFGRQEIYNQLHATMLSASINCTPRLSLSSNISWKNNSGTGSQTTSFAIWNAHSIYRLGKMKNFELKLSALDLLRQNQGIFYSGSNNMLVFRSVNVLQQYFMLTVAWFPRKFGKDAKNNNP